MAKLRGAIECVDLDTGALYRPEHVQALIEQVADTLDTLEVRACPKLAKYLRNRAPGLALAQADLRPKLEALAQHYSLEAVALGCIVWQAGQGAEKASPPSPTSCASPPSARGLRGAAKASR